jgi:transposase
MGLHGNAKLGPAGRRAMVMLVVWDGVSRREAAPRHGVFKTTAKRWVDRYRAASQEERSSVATIWPNGTAYESHQ